LRSALSDGLLAIPVLAGSAAYGVAEAFGWPATLEPGRPMRSGSTPSSQPPPSSASDWASLALTPSHAGVERRAQRIVAVPIMAMMMVIGLESADDGRFKARTWLVALGWIGTALMAWP